MQTDGAMRCLKKENGCWVMRRGERKSHRHRFKLHIVIYNRNPTIIGIHNNFICMKCFSWKLCIRFCQTHKPFNDILGGIRTVIRNFKVTICNILQLKYKKNCQTPKIFLLDYREQHFNRNLKCYDKYDKWPQWEKLKVVWFNKSSATSSR